MSVARRRFRFIKEIAEGGFGKVYLAEQLSADGFSRIVAVKLLHAKWSSHDEVVMRTRDEARLLGLIRHQNIVKVEDLTSIDGKCAIVMEYLEGVDLKYMTTYLREHQQEFPRAALFEIMLLVASALDAAYNGLPLQGSEPLRVIHRDIKPSNIFVTVAGQVKVLDFGTARANFAEREAKTQALAFGSQGYMAPERMLGEEDTPAADVFSLGVTLWELLAGDSFGRIPPRPNKFAQKVEERIQVLRLEGDPEWMEQIREVLRLMCSYEPSERPSAVQLVDIFEILAQDAKDTGLRKFGRSHVAEAKANEPDVDTGDPLTGQVVDEDVSSAFGLGAGGLRPMSDEGPLTSDAQGTPYAEEGSDAGASLPPWQAQASGPGLAVAQATPAPAARADRAPTPQPAPTPAPRSLPPPAEESSGGGGGGLAIVAVILVVLALVAVGVSLAAVAGFIVLNNGESTEAPVPVPEPEPVVEPEPEPEPAAPVPCSVTGVDARDGKRMATKLTVNGAVSEVTVSGGIGFKAEWDGQGECALPDMLAGTYRTNVTPESGSKIRGATFEVTESKKKTCKFEFDVASETWTGGCE